MDIDTNEQLIALCQEALRIPSYSGQEQGVAELMKRKMEEYGFDEVKDLLAAGKDFAGLSAVTMRSEGVSSFLQPENRASTPSTE